MHYSEIGNANNPLRCSGLPRLLQCSLQTVLQMSLLRDDETPAGPAADTGSAVHAAVAEWHVGNQDARLAVARMRERLAEFPLADLDDAENQFNCYRYDPRNINAEVVAVEQHITFTIDPSPLDPTREKIHVRGTLDQIRLNNGIRSVWDIKTSKRDGYSLMSEHTAQLAGYVQGAAQTYKEHHEPGGLILTRKYLERKAPPPALQPPGIFVEMPWTAQQVPSILASIAHTIALIRSGHITFSPGEYCRWCIAGGVSGCIPQLHTLEVRK